MIKLIIDPQKTNLQFNLEDYKDKIELSTMQELEAWIKTKQVVFLDTETDFTTDYHQENAIVCRQVGDSETQFVTTLPIPKELLEPRTIVAHNAEFDYNMLKQDGIILRSVWCTMNIEKVLRTSLYTAKQLQEEQPFKLSAVMAHRFNMSISKEQQTTFTHGYLTLEQVLYAAKDCEILEMLYNAQRIDIKEADLEVCARLENRYTLAAGDMMYFGVYLKREKWMEAYEYTEDLISKRLPTLDAYLEKHHPDIAKQYVRGDLNQINLFDALDVPVSLDEKRSLKFNYKSHVQVKKVLRAMDKLPKDKHGKETTSIKELEKMPLIQRNDWINDLIAYKRLIKRLTSFGYNWLDKINPNTGRIHCSLDQIINTGRTATFSPNLYQMPQDNKYRNSITVEDEDVWSIVGGDYSAQEGRIMAFMSGDPAYIEFYNTGDGDSHSFIASKMFSAQYKCDITITKSKAIVKNPTMSKEDFITLSKLEGNIDDLVTDLPDGFEVDLSSKNVWRQNGKILNFFVSFGGSDHTLHQQLGIPKEEAKQLINSFFGAFPNLKKFFDTEVYKTLKRGYSLSNDIVKRRRLFSEWEEWKPLQEMIEKHKKQVGAEAFFNELKDKSGRLAKANSKAYAIKGNISRAAQNNPIQGTAADMTKEAFCLFRERLLMDGYLPFMGSPIMPILMPHDEIRAQCKVELEKYVGELLADCMDDAAQVFVQGISLRPEIDYDKCWTK